MGCLNAGNVRRVSGRTGLAGGAGDLKPPRPLTAPSSGDVSRTLILSGETSGKRKGTESRSCLKCRGAFEDHLISLGRTSLTSRIELALLTPRMLFAV